MTLPMHRNGNTRPGAGSRWLRGGAALGLLGALAIFVLYVTVPKSNEGLGPVDALVVLGTPADTDGSTTAMQRWRVEEGVAELRRGRGRRIVFTGGAAANRFVEADVMGAYAQALGVPAAAIFRERQAHTTIENVANTAALLRAHRWTTLEVISSAEHLPRAAVLLEGTGLGWRVHAAPTPGRSRLGEAGAYAEEAVGTAALRVFGERSEPVLHSISLLQHRVAWGGRWVRNSVRARLRR